MTVERSLLLRACAYCNAPATGWTRNSEGHPWLLSELLWQVKRATECVLAFTGRRWTP